MAAFAQEKAIQREAKVARENEMKSQKNRAMSTISEMTEEYNESVRNESIAVQSQFGSDSRGHSTDKNNYNTSKPPLLSTS